MEASSWALTVMAWLAALAFLSKISTFKRHQPKFPPGPKPWPIIGNLNLIGAHPHQSLHKLSQKYGPIMQLKLGSVSVVVASSPEMAKQFLKTHDHIFASRPQTAAGKYISYNYTDLLWAPYGPYFRQARKIYMSEVFTPKRIESYEYIRVEERSALLSRLLALSGKPIRVKEHLVRLTLSVISRIVLGNKYFSESESETSEITFKEFKQMIDEWLFLNAALNIGDWIPWLSFLDLQGYVKRMKALKKKFDRFHDHVFDDHKVKREAEKDFVPKDMVDLLLQLADDPNTDHVKLTYDNVKGLTQDLLLGGADTSATTLEWTMSELMKQPHLINKATEELDRVIGKDKWVEEKDIPQLPYINAIMKETMRKHPVAVLLAPHSALEDGNIAGYDISKGSTVLINTWGMGRDPSIWDAPQEFRPERFLGKAIDVKGQYFELLPFGSGRRMCPGYNLGLKVVSSTLANMLHGFEWKFPDNVKPEDLSMEEVYSSGASRKFPLVAVTKPRLPLHLY
ncbi:trimethyltridecatetraene synthase-like [Corylus avellana]|uniref:trimethyltridecatetraene synthase-like n=1 Tax=Corylus avellana TaxID=13451 RepID=UPI00286C89A9|nr:trimethyltridecatetraene synthase-like [Corylus avellana]